MVMLCGQKGLAAITCSAGPQLLDWEASCRRCCSSSM
jgi:hypothetical protein